MKSILFVCIGNTCRSFMAEAIARKTLSNVGKISSAGYRTDPSWPRETLAKQVLHDKLNIAQETSYANLFDDIKLEEYDLFIVLDKGVYDEAIAGNRLKVENTILWDTFDPDLNRDLAQYLETYEQLFERLQALNKDKILTE